MNLALFLRCVWFWKFESKFWKFSHELYERDDTKETSTNPAYTLILFQAMSVYISEEYQSHNMVILNIFIPF
jgi:hypothetical protein